MTHIGNNGPIQANAFNLKTLKKLDAADGTVDGKISKTETLKKNPELAKNLAELKPEDAAAVRQFLDSGTTEELLIQFPIGEKSAPKSGAQPIGVTRLQESALSPALAERLEARKPTTSAPSEPMSLGDRLRQGIKIGMGIDIPKPEEMEATEAPASEPTPASETVAPETTTPDSTSKPTSLMDRVRQGIKISMGIDIPTPEQMETAKTPESTAP